jgi:hypothetical protein
MSWLTRLDAALAQRVCEKSEEGERSGFPLVSAPSQGCDDAKKAPVSPTEAEAGGPFFASPQAGNRAQTLEERLFSHLSLFSQHDDALAGAAAGSEGAFSPPQVDGWLASIARSIRAALADVAVRVADEDGWLVLIRPDGRRLTVAPGIIPQIIAAGLLPALPSAVAEPGGDDADADAERAAIQAEPPLPPAGSPERTTMEKWQAETVRGLLAAAMARPSCFPGEARRPPPKGSFCSCCRGTRWWYPRRVADDGTTPSAHWRCAACRPPVRLSATEIVEVRT